MVELDLHLHTTYSDGTLSPTELVKLCVRRGLKAIAVTDHDSTEGIPEAQAAAEDAGGITLVPGVELSTDVPGGEIHLLGYYVDRNDPQFDEALRGMRQGRDQRAREMVAKLSKLGVDISWERVRELSDGGAIGRPHIAQAMVEGGYVQYPRDAFDKYLGRNGPAYVERVKLTPVQATEVLVRNGAVPAMAHPIYSMSGSDAVEVTKLKRTLTELKDSGLVGMEVYYASYTAEQVDFLAKTASEIGLVPCGGSDYHGSGNPDEPEPGSGGPPMRILETLLSAKQRLGAASSYR